MPTLSAGNLALPFLLTGRRVSLYCHPLSVSHRSTPLTFFASNWRRPQHPARTAWSWSWHPLARCTVCCTTARTTTPRRRPLRTLPSYSRSAAGSWLGGCATTRGTGSSWRSTSRKARFCTWFLICFYFFHCLSCMVLDIAEGTVLHLSFYLLVYLSFFVLNDS